jgi:hypothetical protein
VYVLMNTKHFSFSLYYTSIVCSSSLRLHTKTVARVAATAKKADDTSYAKTSAAAAITVENSAASAANALATT